VCSNISGATSSSYRLGDDDEALSVLVMVTATNANGSAVAVSAASGTIAAAPVVIVDPVVVPPPAASAPPALSGTATVGSPMTASTGTWSGSPTTFAFQWRRCTGGTCVNIPGANTSTYVPVDPDDVGSTISVAVTATGSSGSTTSVSPASAVVVRQGPAVTVPATASFGAGSGQGLTLTASTPVTWSVSGGANAGLFTIVNGVLQFRQTPVPGTYVVQVTATNAAGGTTVQTITVTVNPGPSVTTTTSANGTATITITDPAGGASTAQVVGTSRTGVNATIQNGQVQVTDPTFSGRVTVTIAVTGSNGAITRTTVDLTVPPAPVSSPVSQTAAGSAPTSLNTIATPSTVITWAPSPNAQSYSVSIGGAQAGTTTTTSFTVNRLLARGTRVEITPLGGDSTVGAPVEVIASGGAFTVGNSGFNTNSSVLTAVAKRMLNQVAAVIRSNGVNAAAIEGHTDSVGGSAKNKALSKARAEAVKAYLQAKVGSGIKITLAASAAAKPVASNDTEAGRAANRRVEIRLKF
jgi:outer membrane protein OmpA-like peptidoglycan-associated protein